jgi:dephospho-CoA kinase
MNPVRLVVMGRTCAGKTVLGQFLRRQHGFRHIEASRIIRRKFAQLDEDITLDGLLIREGRDLVAKSVLRRLGRNPVQPFVVTGIRLQEELATITASYEPLVVWVEASEDIRLQRYLSRRRWGSGQTVEEFIAEEEAEEKVLSVSPSNAHVIIHNEGTLEDYWAQAKKLLSDMTTIG